MLVRLCPLDTQNVGDATLTIICQALFLPVPYLLVHSSTHITIYRTHRGTWTRFLLLDIMAVTPHVQISISLALSHALPSC
jgi:hypothetical protein